MKSIKKRKNKTQNKKKREKKSQPEATGENRNMARRFRVGERRRRRRRNCCSVKSVWARKAGGFEIERARGVKPKAVVAQARRDHASSAAGAAAAEARQHSLFVRREERLYFSLFVCFLVFHSRTM